MFNKTFQELYDFELKSFTKSKGFGGGKSFDYIPWDIYIKLLHDLLELNIGDFDYAPMVNEDGGIVFYSSGLQDKYLEGKKESAGGKINDKILLPEVRVKIKLKGIERIAHYPVISGSIVHSIENIDQLKVSNAVQRGMVKGCSTLTGLGLRLWNGEDDALTETALSTLITAECKEYFVNQYESLCKNHKNGVKGVLSELQEELGIADKLQEKQINKIISTLDSAIRFENAMNEVGKRIKNDN